MITDDALEAYAQQLERAGFTIYEPRRVRGGYFRYSRRVNGVECFGYVQHDYFGGYSHSMPIKPSAEHGSSMWVEGVPGELSVVAAIKVARPANYNPIVGRHANYADPRWADMYVKRGESRG